MIAVEIKTLTGHPPKDKTVGTITLDGKTLSYKVVDDKYKTLMKNVFEADIIASGKRVKPSDAETWITNLYREYHSYALRATKPK